MRLAFIAFALLVAASAAADPVTTVILVRHAEKLSAEDQDSPLSAAGAARARELARVLASTPIDVIYTTQYLRTRQTAQPVAKALGIESRVASAGREYAAGLAARIRSEHRGQTVLVVGHSNSTRDVLRELGVKEVPEIAESQYDHLFVCSVTGETAKLVALRYGAPSAE